VLPILKDGTLGSELQTMLAFYVILNSIQFKHPAYEHEREFRALILGDRKKIARHKFHDVRERNGELVEYIRRPIYPSLRKVGVLRHIRIGSASPKGLIQQVKNALWSLHIPEPKIDKSEIPYRSIRATERRRAQSRQKRRTPHAHAACARAIASEKITYPRLLPRIYIPHVLSF
jgi:hypothetical protein